MAADAELVERVRHALRGEADLGERRMFGGVCFTLGGHMACGVQGDDLVVRVGPHAHAAALAERHVRPMDFTGKSLEGFVYVAPLGCAGSRELRKWIRRGVRFARTLPPKDGRARLSKRRNERAKPPSRRDQ